MSTLLPQAVTTTDQSCPHGEQTDDSKAHVPSANGRLAFAKASCWLSSMSQANITACIKLRSSQTIGISVRLTCDRLPGKSDEVYRGLYRGLEVGEALLEWCKHPSHGSE